MDAMVLLSRAVILYGLSFTAAALYAAITLNAPLFTLPFVPVGLGLTAGGVGSTRQTKQNRQSISSVQDRESNTKLSFLVVFLVLSLAAAIPLGTVVLATV